MGPDIQVIIAVDYPDSRLFPLAENIPPSLLPITNQTLLCHQLYQIEKCGGTGELTQKLFIHEPDRNY
jgi:hypothetical protein